VNGYFECSIILFVLCKEYLTVIKIHNTILSSNKVLNMLIYGASFYVIIYWTNYKLLKLVQFLPTL